MARPPIHTDEVPDVASLKTPESPAFIALGTAPSAIQRPSTPTGLAASLANGLASGKGLGLFRNFALEFSPYWLLPHPDLSFEQVLSQSGRAWYRNFSLSFASGEDEVDVAQADGTTTRLELGRAAAGVRVTIWPGDPSLGAMRCLAYIKSAAEISTLAFSAEKHTFLAKWDAEHPRPQVVLSEAPNPGDYPDLQLYKAAEAAWRAQRAAERESLTTGRTYQAFLEWRLQRDAAVESFLEDYRESHPNTDEKFSHCLAAIHAKSGFMAETAFALTVSAPEGDLQRVSREGSWGYTGWLTTGYVFEDIDSTEGDSIEASALLAARASLENDALGPVDLVEERRDVGLRLALARQQAGLAVEGTLRSQELSTQSGSQLLWRLALNLDYRVSGGMWLSAAFGKDFGDTKDQTPLLALANVQWNFGLDRGVQPDTTATSAQGAQ